MCRESKRLSLKWGLKGGLATHISRMTAVKGWLSSVAVLYLGTRAQAPCYACIIDTTSICYILLQRHMVFVSIPG